PDMPDHADLVARPAAVGATGAVQPTPVEVRRRAATRLDIELGVAPDGATFPGRVELAVRASADRPVRARNSRGVSGDTRRLRGVIANCSATRPGCAPARQDGDEKQDTRVPGHAFHVHAPEPSPRPGHPYAKGDERVDARVGYPAGRGVGTPS